MVGQGSWVFRSWDPSRLFSVQGSPRRAHCQTRVVFVNTQELFLPCNSLRKLNKEVELGLNKYRNLSMQSIEIIHVSLMLELNIFMKSILIIYKSIVIGYFHCLFINLFQMPCKLFWNPWNLMVWILVTWLHGIHEWASVLLRQVFCKVNPGPDQCLKFLSFHYPPCLLSNRFYSKPLIAKETSLTSRAPLTHLPLDKMAAISQMTLLNAFSWRKSFEFGFKITLKFVPMGLIDNKWGLVQVMAWRQSGAKPLSEPMLTQFIDTYMRH